MLLLLDSCAMRDAPAAGSHGTKQAIAAYSPDQRSRDPAAKSFTSNLVDALQRLATDRPFNVQRLYEEIMASSTPPPDSVSASASGAQTPVFLTLTPPQKARTIYLVPLASQVSKPGCVAPAGDPDGQSRTSRATSPVPATDVTFEEPRVLVCTTFVGEASSDMAFFNQWLNNPPPAASKVNVEGMFLGPPTMLMISMPHSTWSVVQHDKVCCFLGYITSHNMLHLYNRLVGSAFVNGGPRATAVEAGRVLHGRGGDGDDSRNSLEARLARRESMVDHAGVMISSTDPVSALQSSPNQPPTANAKDEGADSAEMQEAAEQLKALSHVRPLNEDVSPARARLMARAGDNIDVVRHQDMLSSPDADDSGNDEAHYGANHNSSETGPKARRPLQKQALRQETQCGHCSHVPFKDSSSLRKHVAAAHTRPFPCAFSFAGCTSTFGSKNEWKRHIASQHLCLQFYRCSSCSQSTSEGKGNEFNRKDLFTQHLRRMHAPFAIKKAIAKGDSKLQGDWEIHVKEMQASCLVTRRQPPYRSACPKPDCQSAFEGPGSWDEWTEHVGRHMEKGEAQRLGVDPLLTQWALDEAIIEQKEGGEYRLCGGGGGSGGGGGAAVVSGAGNNGDKDASLGGDDSFIADAAKTEDEDPSITVAISLPEPAG
jgi:hypothetical protein